MTQGPAGLWSLAWAMASVVKGSEAKKKKNEIKLWYHNGQAMD